MIYIDTIKKYKCIYRCHMIAVDQDLRSFARRIGAHYYHANPFPHYDLTEEQRKNAIAHGAVEVTTRELVRIYRERNR